MLFEQIATGGCQSYLVGCNDSCAAALIDPGLSQVDRYAALGGGMAPWCDARFPVRAGREP